MNELCANCHHEKKYHVNAATLEPIPCDREVADYTYEHIWTEFCGCKNFISGEKSA
jgi:hypothetical protein